MMLITIIYHMMTWQWQHSFPQFPNCPQVPLPHQLILSHAMSIWMTLKGRSTALAKRLTDFSLMVTAMPLPMPLTPRYYTYCPTQCLQQHNQQSTPLLCTAVLILMQLGTRFDAAYVRISCHSTTMIWPKNVLNIMWQMTSRIASLQTLTTLPQFWTSYLISPICPPPTVTVLDHPTIPTWMELPQTRKLLTLWIAWFGLSRQWSRRWNIPFTYTPATIPSSCSPPIPNLLVVHPNWDGCAITQPFTSPIQQIVPTILLPPVT